MSDVVNHPSHYTDGKIDKMKDVPNLNKYIERNKQVALENYGDKLNDDREVVGTNIYFDWAWRIHEKEPTENATRTN